MSRSKHTAPRAILAARRLRRPDEARGAGDASGRFRRLRWLKERGIAAETGTVTPSAERPARGPRLIVRRPGPGLHHPASRADIVAALRCGGVVGRYGLRAIELRPGLAGTLGARQPFGRLRPPGRIILFAQPPAPWRLPGRLTGAEQARLARAGAVIEASGLGMQTVVHWPGTTLRDFMLFDVLMHEIGHHIIQHATGKRCARIARTGDHEAFADRFAARCRQRAQAAAEGVG